MPVASRRPSLKLNLGAVLAGAAWGVVLRIAFGHPGTGQIFGVMTAGFIFVVPLTLGMLTVRLAPVRSRRRWAYCFFAPWVSSLLCLVTLAALAYEGSICLVMMTPAMLAMATFGGLVMRLYMGPGDKEADKGNVNPWGTAAVAILPLLVTPIERQISLPQQVRRVENTIEIDAPAAVVWANIIRVPEIRKDEAQPSWSHRIGFPMPLEATLSHEGVGGVRHATFERGVLFVETVDVWEPERRLAFSIKADPVPATTLDEHVTVGGPFFDVLRGEYEIEPKPGGGVVLHLASEHRLSTHFNLYASVWTDGVMRDVQKLILSVLKRRCEAGG